MIGTNRIMMDEKGDQRAPDFPQDGFSDDDRGVYRILFAHQSIQILRDG